jgi:hypothetical protein
MGGSKPWKLYVEKNNFTELMIYNGKTIHLRKITAAKITAAKK